MGYRCLYCRKVVSERDLLMTHEKSCEAKRIVTRMWAMVIEKAKRKGNA